VKKKQLIVNADDFGRTSGINAGIELAYRQGILSSTSIVANSPAFEPGLDIVRRNPGMGTGVHLTINEYGPLHDHPFLHFLRGKNHLQLLMALARARKEDLLAVETEFASQIERVMSHGIVPTHIDGHGHCHVQPALVPLVCRLAQRFQIRRARLPKEDFFYPGPPARMAQKWVLNAMCARGFWPLREGLRCPDRFFGFTDGGNLRAQALGRILARVPGGVSELMCHVGTEADDPPFHIGYNWRIELETVTRYTKDQLIAEFGIEVISYGDLAT